MKRLLFVFFATRSIVACTQQDTTENERSESEHLSFWWPKHDSINHAYVMAADPIWQFGRHGEDIYDWSYQDKWHTECRMVLIHTF